MKPLKETFYNKAFYRALARDLHTVYPPLRTDAFYQACTEGLETLELKARMIRAADVCRRFLPADYRRALGILYDYTESLSGNNFYYMFLPEFVARHGLEHYALSIKALHDFTRYSSSELAIRRFLESDLDTTLQHMRDWTRSDDVHVRRLASEGCRPRLPWAPRVPDLLTNPRHGFTILQQLRTDPDRYVQKSVANHINDISKDHPEWLLKKLSTRTWQSGPAATQWIVRHGLRTLVKQGDAAALQLLGVDPQPRVRIGNVTVASRRIRADDCLDFGLEITSTGNTAQKLVVDYAIHFKKKNGATRAKVFKLKTVDLDAGETVNIKKKYRFTRYTTRTHYPGQHKLDVIVNGDTVYSDSFELLAN
jgi:3-methyladenine DNA glycosylase AlkC